MALRNQPYIPLYVQDFLTDEKLIECSAESTGVYIRLICILHKSEEYGKILLKQKDKQDSKQIKNFALKLLKQMPYTLELIEKSLNELINEGVLLIEGDYLYQKRMVRDNDISLKRSESGKKGGEKTQFASKFAKAKIKAKRKANYENENEDINEDINKDLINNKLSSFEQFYKSYPKKKSRGQAEKAFSKINPDEQLLTKILESVERAKKSEDWIKEKCKYIPHPATWLNAKGWLDEEPETHPLAGKVSDKTIQNIESFKDWRPPA
jgi:hypothetical protein